MVTVKMLDTIASEIEEAIYAEEYESVIEDAKRRELFLSLTLSDDALSDIYSGIKELAIMAEEGQTDELIVAKGRLLCQIEHQRRLSGFNARSIF